MKKILSALLCASLLTGCGNSAPADPLPAEVPAAPAYTSRFDRVTQILLSDDGITVDGGGETESVYTSHDILYYEDRDFYDSGNPYGEGTDADRHTAEEAAAHTVLNITSPGTYRVSGSLSSGQIRIDLGEDARENPDAVVELILDSADITCTVAPAILFLNVYECDAGRSAGSATPDVDTSAAGAILVLEGSSTVNGSYVAKIFKDTDGEKKLWKQDGAIYSYMSMNVFGPGSLELNAANEGLDTEMHLTVNGGNIRICSGNDGINTNEDGVSVTTVNGGSLTIYAGLGDEGDGIDSNGYLVINGGSVLSSAKPAADAGLDSDLGSFIHGGTVIAMGSAMDWAEGNSGQVTVNLQFAQQQKAGSRIAVTRDDGTELFSFEDSSINARGFSGLILSHPCFQQGETYCVYVDGVPMAYTGTDVRHGPGGMRPMDFDPENIPEGFDPAQTGSRGPRPEAEGRTPPDGFDPGAMAPPDNSDGRFSEGNRPPEIPEGGFRGYMQEGIPGSDPSSAFYMNDKVNFFSGVAAAQ